MDLNLILVIVGVAASLLTSLIKQEKWSDKTKQSVSVVLSLVGGTITVYFSENNISPEEVLRAWAATLGISQAVFMYLLRQSGLEKTLRSIGAKKA